MKLSEITFREVVRNPRRNSETTKLVRSLDATAQGTVDIEVHETGNYVTLTFGEEKSIVSMGNVSFAKVAKAAPGPAKVK